MRHSARRGIDGALSLLAPNFRTALAAAYSRLDELGAEPVICGGLAVGVHGVSRMTGDIDFLVGDGIYSSSPGDLIVTLKHGVPVEVAGIPIDVIPESDEVTVADCVVVGDYRVVTLPALVAMKLGANRPKDRWDVGALITAGIIDERTVDSMQDRWPAHAARLSSMFDPRGCVLR